MRELKQYEVDAVNGAGLGGLIWKGIKKVGSYFKSKPVETGVVIGSGAAGAVDGATGGDD